ncbi:hypothetical protein BDV93DRAFT_594620 [Ceratobasidium sp. AG-I]|nr:hypothetical protein BDV93DRAFT_594620 [Ceratobasidium sp. AG-I]
MDTPTKTSSASARFISTVGAYDPPANLEATPVRLDGSDSEDEWLLEDKPSAPNISALGSIEDYLRTEPVSSEVIHISGGPLQYWESQKLSGVRTRLAQFALDYLSAPALSVDAGPSDVFRYILCEDDYLFLA